MRIDSMDNFYMDSSIEKNHIKTSFNKSHLEYRNNNYLFKEKDFLRGVNKIKEKLEIHSQRLEFSIHEKTRDIIVKVVNNDTNEIIREIPSEKLIDMVANMLENAGLLINEKI